MKFELAPRTFSGWSLLSLWQRILIGALWGAGVATAGIGLSAALSSSNVLMGLTSLAVALASIALSVTHLTWLFTRKKIR